MYGSVIDSTCIYWSEQCGYHGNCLLYDLVYFRYRYVGMLSLNFNHSSGRQSTKKILQFLTGGAV